MDHWHYLFLLIACLALTAPLEFFGPGVYRRPRLLLGAVLPVALFIVWDLLAIAANVWDFNPAYLLGVRLPGGMPLEELLFFAVIPLCGLLTFTAVEHLLGRRHNARARAETSG
ncbi:lycopene cyclase domain-containing protein [Nocardia sp. NPDC051052]|uniref:lycopene cyclase domain-containing protein n=1 Tax=Nocardia sp. NPDC051052 TaxID=3364322 RepID=UPI00379ECE1B